MPSVPISSRSAPAAMRRPAVCSWSDTSDDEETDEAGREPGEIVVEAPRDLEDGELPSASCAAEGECDVGEVKLTRRRRHLRLDVAHRPGLGKGEETTPPPPRVRAAEGRGVPRNLPEGSCSNLLCP